MDRRPTLSPIDDTHPVPAPVRALISGIVQAVRAGDDPAIRTLLERLAPVADTTALLLRYRLGLGEESADAGTHLRDGGAGAAPARAETGVS
ncbi:hypothetical protein ACFW24_13385 [Streptomyces nigra]|uniref:hypothetical protein n=1 Tax=Streptomyces nigra TaxID=1827580 RepID=UPI0036D02D8F